MNNSNPTYQELKNKIAELEAKLAKTEWLYEKENIPETEPYIPYYGDVTELNTERTILDNVGKETLQNLTSELMDLLDTSVAIYEKNGDYAFGVFNSGWCQVLEASSRKLCNTDDNKVALNCGKWHCHDDCWNNSAKAAIISKKSTDIDCIGAIKLYAEPIFVGDEVIGVINIGYGNPPTDDKTLRELSEKFSVDFETLRQKALDYKQRPDFIIEIAKKRLKSIAKLIGEIVSRKKAELSLKNSKNRYKKLIEGLPDIIYIYNRDKGATYWSYQVEKILGFSQNELNNEPLKWTNQIHKDDIEKVNTTLRTIKENDTFNLEYRIYDTNGNIHWFHDRAFSITKINGELIIEGIATDITERKKAEQELKESERKFRTLFENSQAAISFFDPNYKLAMQNETNAKLLGGKREEFLGKSIYDLFPDAADFHVERFKKVGASRKAEIFEDAFNLPNGTKWFSSLLQPIFNDKEQFEGIQIIAIDITDRKIAEKDREELLRFNNVLFNETPIGLAVYTKEGQCIRTNKNTGSMIGATREQILQQNFHQIESWKKSGLYDKALSALKNNRTEYLTANVTSTFNKNIWISCKFTPFRTGNASYLMVLYDDITKQKKAEEALHESQTKYKGLFGASPDAILLADRSTGIIVEANHATERLFETPLDKIIGRHQSQLHPEPQNKKAKTSFKNKPVHENQPANPVEIDIVTARNQIKSVEIRGSIINIKGKEHVLGTFRDITDRKKAEKALKESETKLKSVISAIPDLVFHLDKSGKYLSYYQKPNQKLYRETSEFIGKTVFDIFDTNFAQKVFNCIQHTIKHDSTELYYSLALEKPYYYYAKVAKINENEVIIIARDITDLKEKEQALKESEQKLNEIYNSTSEAIVVHDEKTGKIVDCNNATLSMYGYTSKNEMLELTVKDVSAVENRCNQNKIAAHIQQAIENNGHTFEWLAKKKNGAVFWVEVNLKKTSIDRKDRLLAVARDITNRKKAEQALKVSEEKYRELNATKDKFFSIISHDLKNPLNAISGFSELALKKAETNEYDKVVKYCQIIRDAAKQNLNLLDNLLQWSRVQRGQIAFNPKLFNLNDIVQGVIELLHANYSEKNIQLTVHIPENLRIFADKFMLETTIRNLLSNAIKFTAENGWIKISAKQQNNDIHIAIEDNGIGISKEDVDKLFRIESNFSTEGTRNEKGSGLGLILCKEFIEKHSGKIWVRSKVEEGTTFNFTIKNT